MRFRSAASKRPSINSMGQARIPQVEPSVECRKAREDFRNPPLLVQVGRQRRGGGEFRRFEPDVFVQTGFVA